MRASVLASARAEAARGFRPVTCSNGVTAFCKVDILPPMGLKAPPRTPPRRGLDAFVLPRDSFTSTFDEHNAWHGSMPSLHPVAHPSVSGQPRGLTHSLSKGSFQLKAYKSGVLRPGARDVALDRTVTEFSDPSPSRTQRHLARVGYSALGEEWKQHVQAQHARQDRLDLRQYEKAMYAGRTRGIESHSLAHLTRMDSRLSASLAAL